MQVSVTDAKGQLTELVRRAEAGDLLFVGDDFAQTDLEAAVAP